MPETVTWNRSWPPTRSPRGLPLTAREAEVLELAADGAPVADIAERASLSQGTVRNYLPSAVSEPGAENRHAAVRLARQRGWV